MAARDVLALLGPIGFAHAEVDAALQHFTGLGEAARFAAWHALWQRLGVEGRTRVLTALAGDVSPGLTAGEISAMTWRVPRGRGIYPDAVLEITNGPRPRMWAVLEYKLGAALNGPLLASVLDEPNDGQVPSGLDEQLADSIYRWQPDGPLRVPQLVAYYAARERLFHRQVDAHTRWILLTPSHWKAGWDGMWALTPDAWSPRGHTRIAEVPVPWQRRSVQAVVEAFLELAPGSAGALRDDVLRAIAAVHAPPDSRRWFARTHEVSEMPLASLEDAVAGGCGLWDGCIDAVWCVSTKFPAPHVKIRLDQDTGYRLANLQDDGRGDLLDLDDPLMFEHPEALALAAALIRAGQVPWNHSCRRGCDPCCGCVDVTGAKLATLRTRRARDLDARCVFD